MQRFLPLLITIFSLFTAHSAFSQGIWKTYTRADGLVGDSVLYITQDKLGNYWFGTNYAGLSKLDTNGIWTNFIKSSDSTATIWDIEIDSLNNKWLIVNQHRGVFSGAYVVKFDDSSFTYYNPPGGDPIYGSTHPVCLGQDATGNIWCGTTQGTAYWFDGIAWHLVYVPGLGRAWSFVNEIKTDHFGNLYFAHDEGISTVERWIFGPAWTRDIDFDRQNRLWFGTYDYYRPLGMFDEEKWHSYTTKDGLLHSDVWDIAVDSSNNIWISYFVGPKVSKFDGRTFTHIDLPPISAGRGYSYMMDIYIDKKGEIWFASDKGVLVFKDTMTTKVAQITGVSKSKIEYSLLQNVPNPFNSMTSIQYILTNKGTVYLSIYNIKGEEVKKLVDENQLAGIYQVVWKGSNENGKEVSSGIYIAVLRTESSKQSIKLSLIR